MAIQRIEKGTIKASAFVVAICDELSIPLPEHMANRDDATWIELGRLLRQSPDNHRLAVELVRKLLGPAAPAEVTEGDLEESPLRSK